MQNAMQGAMVLALSGSDECGALATKSQKNNRAWLQNITPDRPPQVMASYNTLLDRIQRAELLEGPVPELSPEDRRNLERLNELRRRFAHFNPMGWVIELNYILEIMPIALNTFEHLTTTQRRPNLHFNDEHQVRMKHALAQARAALDVFNK